jgi:transposase
MSIKRFNKLFKEQIVKEVYETGNAALVARNHNIVHATVTRWVREAEGRSKEMYRSKAKQIEDPSLGKNSKELAKENEQLKKLLGEKDLKIAILEDLLKKTNRR